ncbi:hypothetical protein [Shewanella fodinae]|uniref:Uncharacterized protein n=1 Tax=Shewanella fodinae TaxID=552357 RepID=A0A4R2FGS9_9GAMM|nr:hypothetical protein [Shewanella fodinae]TCN85852.1 hypothetical protein EDC91_10891 [Shewanella fodinae]
MYRSVCSLILLLLGGCACTTHLPPKADITMPDAHTLRFKGDTRIDDVKRLLAVAEDAPEPISRLIITSAGGNPTGGMMLGEWVHKQQIELEVSGICAGSCANYIFTAAKSVKVNADSVVGFSGGAWQQHWDKPWYTFLIPDADPHKCLSVVEWRQRESAFFRHIGVREEITIMGQVAPFNQQLSGKGLWSYQAEDLSKFGLHQVYFAAKPLLQSQVQILQFTPGALEDYLASSRLQQGAAP